MQGGHRHTPIVVGLNYGMHGAGVYKVNAKIVPKLESDKMS
jgi:hypothetical protein